MVRTEQEAIDLLKEIVSELDKRANPEYTLSYPAEWWIEIRKAEWCKRMTIKAIESAKSNKDGYIGTFGGAKCYISQAW